MKNAVPVSVTTLDMDEPEAPAVDVFINGRHAWIDVLSIVLLAIAVLVGLDFWSDWFSSVDRIICSVCVLIGLIVAFFRSTWEGNLTRPRIAFACVLCCMAGVLICISYFVGRPKLSGIACGLILAAWCSMRILGESYQHRLALGLVFAIPSAIDAVAARGAFSWLESVAVSVTSGLADATDQSHVREDDKLIFGPGVANNFSCLGKWDSLLSFFGISVFCILAFRRNLVAAIVAVTLSALVWIAVRGSAWVTLVWLGNQNGDWYEWSPGFEIGLFFFGALLVVSIEQLFSALLEPIPFEFINTDFPLFAIGWNWLSGLPKLTITVPQREDASDQVEMED